jgi:hypothetical protein
MAPNRAPLTALRPAPPITLPVPRLARSASAAQSEALRAKLVELQVIAAVISSTIPALNVGRIFSSFPFQDDLTQNLLPAHSKAASLAIMFAL